MKKTAVILFVLLSSTLTGTAAVAAPPEINAAINPDSILIGDRFSLAITVHKDMMQVVEFPSFEKGELTKGIEVIDESPLDTVKVDGRMQTLRKEYRLTSFDAGNYALSGFPILYGDKNITDTLYTADTVRLVVKAPAVDTEKGAIKDIKAPEKAPFRLGEVGWYIAAGIMLACIIVSIIYLIRRAILKRRGNATFKAEAESVPPHIRAIHDLEALHNQKLWQSGRHKQYYTRLTDIIRLYISQRYGTNTLEMTSEEIVNASKTLPLSDKQRLELADMLRTADLVKFAKYVPEAGGNDKVYYAAYYFVEETKEVPEETPSHEQNTRNDEK